jgi:hypothetical protein
LTSARKIAANRTNAHRSTGPKTAAGRAKAAKNARSHGLAIPVPSDPALSAEAETMAKRIAGDGAPELVELAQRIAEAQIDVIRVRRARADLISRALARPNDRVSIEQVDRQNKAAHLEQLLQATRHSMAAKSIEQVACLIAVLRSAKENLPHFGPEFAAIDRYERRALSRRKRVIRAFDRACASAPRGGVGD